MGVETGADESGRGVRMSDTDNGIRALAAIHKFARSESRIAKMQAEEAKKVEDYRAADRHASYALAMAKITAKSSSLARNVFKVDVEEYQ